MLLPTGRSQLGSRAVVDPKNRAATQAKASHLCSRRRQQLHAYDPSGVNGSVVLAIQDGRCLVNRMGRASGQTSRWEWTHLLGSRKVWGNEREGADGGHCGHCGPGLAWSGPMSVHPSPLVITTRRRNRKRQWWKVGPLTDRKWGRIRVAVEGETGSGPLLPFSFSR